MNACVPPIISEAVEGVIVIVVNTGGDNVSRHQVELRLKYGLPLNVAIQVL